jgi:hypothetical protein
VKFVVAEKINVIDRFGAFSDVPRHPMDRTHRIDHAERRPPVEVLCASLPRLDREPDVLDASFGRVPHATREKPRPDARALVVPMDEDGEFVAVVPSGTNET